MYLEFLVVCLTVFTLYSAESWTIYEFEPIQMDKTLKDEEPLDHFRVDSVVHCADRCCSHSSCTSFSFDCLILTSGVSGLCLLFGTTVEMPSELVPSWLCYVQRKGLTSPFGSQTTDQTTFVPVPLTSTSSLPATTTTGYTTANSTALTVYDIIYGPLDMCSSAPSSQKDFIVITTDGVYIYDDYSDLTTGPCKGPLNFKSVFDGYGSLNTVDQVSGTLVYQNKVELYSSSNSKVYKWFIQPQTLTKDTASAYPSYLTSLLDTKTIYWAAMRYYMSDERHFYTGGESFFMASTQDGNRNFKKSDTVFNMNGFNLNPWSDIPDNVVAVCGHTSDPNKNFILIDNQLQIYTYQLNHNANNNDPTKTVTPLGTLTFTGY